MNTALVGKTIKKNVLFDLKHNKFVHNINSKAVIRCPLDQLSAELDHRPYYHITDAVRHRAIADYYLELVRDKT